MERKVVMRNVTASIILQLVTIISGFVVPKIILLKFGSEVNGLVSSVNQFLSYISLLEGGVGGVIRAALYKPLKEKNYQKMNAIINAAESFFRKIALIYAAYALILALVYPHFVKTGFSNTYSFLLIVVLGANLFIQYYFSLTYKILLTADRKVFIISLSQILIILINMLSVIVCAYVFSDILIIKLASAVIFVIQPVIYNLYVKKHYKIDKKIEKDVDSIQQRWNGLGVNLAAFIHNNTDIVILTMFSALSDVSVYSIYSMIALAVKNIVVAVSSAIEPSFGRTLVGDDDQQKQSFFDKYAYIIGALSTVGFTCTLCLITPFIDIYTREIQDTNYHQEFFGYILVIAEMVYCFRDPYINVAYSSGKYKEISASAIIEAVLNIVVSLILVSKLSYLGVAIGTLTAMTYRMLAQVVYVKKNILKRPILKFVKSIMVFSVASAASFFLCRLLITVNTTSYFTWAFSAFQVALIVGLITLTLSAVFYMNELKQILPFFRKKG